MAQPPTQVEKAQTHLASPHVATFLVSLFEHLFLPILPGVLIQLAPKIATDPTLQEVLADVRVVIDQIAPAAPPSS